MKMEQKSLMKDTGEGRIDVAFTRDIRIKWDWNDLLEDAVTAEENLNLTVAGLVLSRNAEISGRTLEKTMRQLGFDRIVSDNYRLSTETKNAVSKPARTFGHKAIEKDGDRKDHQKARQYHADGGANRAQKAFFLISNVGGCVHGDGAGRGLRQYGHFKHLVVRDPLLFLNAGALDQRKHRKAAPEGEQPDLRKLPEQR